MKTVSDRIKEARETAGLSISELARRVGVSRAAASQWELGSTKSPSSQNIFMIASATGFSAKWISTGRGAKHDAANVAEDGAPPYKQEERLAPVISWVQAGEWNDANDPFPAGYSDEWERAPDQAGKHAFWLRVVGDSMTSPSGLSVPEGMLILVDPDYPAISGRLVVAKLTDSQQVTFKKLIEDAGRRYLKPLNPAYPMIEVNGNCRIIGAVREAKVKL